MPDKIPKEELLSEICAVADLLDEAPTRKDMREIGAFGVETYENRFGTYQNALKKAIGETPTKTSQKIEKQKLLDHFENLADQLGRRPTKEDMDKYGDYSSSTYENTFPSWNEMVEISTYEPHKIESGKEHPAWRGGHDEYYGSNWEKQRMKALERDGYECQDCGMSNENHEDEHNQSLHVHHIQPARKFNDYEKQNRLTNLITLCFECHNKWEGIPLRPVSQD